MIAKSRLKFMIAVGVALTIVVGVLATLMLMGRLLAYFNTGADRASIFQLVPTVPVDLSDRVTWLPDEPSVAAGRAIAPYTRDQIAGAYLLAWAQLGISYELGQPYGLKTYFSPPTLDAMQSAITSTVAAGWQIRQSNLSHTLRLTFLSDDGSIAAFTDHNAHLVQQLLGAEGELTAVIESNSVYDVVMRLEDGNWRIRDLVRRGEGSAMPESPLVTAPLPGIVTVRGEQLWLDGEPFDVAGINYYPQASPWTQFWPQYRPTQTATDLDLIRSLGLNTVRIFVSYADFGADAVQPREIAKLTHFLDQAHARQLKVIVTIFDHHTDHHVSTWAADDRHLAGLLPHFAEHPAILAWDIKNEADRDYGYNTQPLVDAWLRHVAAVVRRHDPNHLLTIGWSQPEAAAHLTEIVDFVSFHYFEELADYETRLAALLAATDKPVLLQEFVMSTWNSFWPHGHTEAEQALYYATLLRSHRRFDTAGYMVWTLRDFDEVPLAEFGTPWQRATQAHMGLFRRDGTAKPAAAVIAPDAALDLPPLPWWSRWVKPFWLMMYGLVLMGAGVVGLLIRQWQWWLGPIVRFIRE